MLSKVCSRCDVEKPTSEFSKRYDRPVGVRPWCRECQRKMDIEKRKTDAGKKKYRTQLWRQAGVNISYEQYKEKFNLVQGCCEICNTAFPSLCVDHNHETSEIRGLLCTPCNLAIEHLKESTEIMNNAIKYLNKYGGRNV